MNNDVAAGIYADISSLIKLGMETTSERLSFNKSAKSLLAGAHASKLRGRGMDFTESREYLPGDDVRHIDWRVTARTGKTHTKQFSEERERPVFIVADFSRSMFFGTQGGFKSVTAARAAAIIAWKVVTSGDRIGGVLSCYDEITHLKPMSARRGALKMIHALSSATMFDQQVLHDIKAQPLLNHGLEHACQVVHPGSTVVVLSDFSGHDEDTNRWLGRLGKHNDVMACYILDPLECELPGTGKYVISDGESRAVLGLDSRQGRNRYTHFISNRQQQVSMLFSRLGIPLVQLMNHLDLAEQMRLLFGGHRQKLGARNLMKGN